MRADVAVSEVLRRFSLLKARCSAAPLPSYPQREMFKELYLWVRHDRWVTFRNILETSGCCCGCANAG